MDSLPKHIVDTLYTMKASSSGKKGMIINGNKNDMWMYSKERYCYLILNGYSVELIPKTPVC
jgi:hypothetical protein